MDDRFMNELRAEPDPAFAGALRSRLRRTEAPRARRVAWRPAVAAAAFVAVVAALFVFPSVRASAQAMLDMFRVRNFAAVSFDESRLEKLRDSGSKDEMMKFGTTEVLQDPGKPVEVPTPEAAGAQAGIDVRVPRDLPDGMRLEKVMVEGAGAARFTADARRLQSVLETLALDDVHVPPGFDGKTITVRKPPIVVQQYRSARRQVALVQARSPEVELPAGLDLAELAEVGLRILGVDRSQARQIARSMDWHSTLLVPVPQNASSFRRVEIQGQPGLLITMKSEKSGGRDRTLVLWSQGDRVYALSGDLDGMPMMQMAESVH